MICDYGCGREAIHKFGTGKWCCSKLTQQCPKVRKKNSETQKSQHKNVWNKGLTKNDSRVLKNTSSANKTRSERFKQGSIKIWNKGLDKTDLRVKKYSLNVSKTKKGKPNYKLRTKISPLGVTFGYFRNLFKKHIYEIWVFPILKRDEFKCSRCGRNDELEVHHIKPYRIIFDECIKFYDLDIENYQTWSEETIDNISKFIIENHTLEIGITLCKNCHSKIDPNRKQFLRKEERGK